MLCLQRRVIRTDIQLLHSWTTFSGDLHASLLSYSNQDHTFTGDDIIPVLKQQTGLLLRQQRSAYSAQTTSHFNSAYLFWRPLFLTPKSTGLLTTGNTPNACSTLLFLFPPLTTTTSTKANSQLKPLLNL